MQIGRLTYNTNTEEGEVHINESVLPNDVVGLDILQDWIVLLTDMYNAKREEVFPKSDGDNNEQTNG